MFTLSTRAKEAIKTGLAIVVAYAIALYLGWEKPYWAGFAVAMVSLDTGGQSLNKATMRMLGTLVAGTVAFILIALFPQDRWLMLLSLSVYYGFCTYRMTLSKRPYFWFVSAFVCMVIMVDAAPADPLRSFQIVVARVEETGMGILVYSLIATFLWPRSSRGDLEEASRSLAATQDRLFRTYRGLLAGQVSVEESRSLRMQEVQLVGQVGQALNAAETDSYAVWEVRRQWRRFHELSTELMDTFERWRESFPEVQQLELTKILPNREAVASELAGRLAQVERMLAGKPPTAEPKPVSLAFDHDAVSALTHFQKAAVAVTRTELERIDKLSRLLFECVGDIKGFASQDRTLPRIEARRPGLTPDPDGLAAALRVMAAQWIAFLVWVYLDPPGHALFVFMATHWTMGAVMLRASPLVLLPGFILGIVFGGIAYVFVMPHLSGYLELGLLLFGLTFGAFYLLSEPHRRVTRSVFMAIFQVVISIDNEQTYDFAAYANTSAAILLSLVLAVALAYVPRSPRPEKVFLRLLRRFFRHAEYLMSRMALDWKESRGLVGRLRARLYSTDLLALPPKLAVWGAKIDYRAFPDNTREQVQALVTALDALAMRIKVLVDAGEHRQADLLVRELSNDVRPWRVLVQEQFRLWAENPASEVEPGVDPRERMMARLARLEKRIAETFSQAEEGELSAEDYENFYRLLGSYRGLSESGINYVRLADKINWAQWQEARF